MELKSCPFCNGGETRVRENHYWTGMSSKILSVYLEHWCTDDGMFPKAYMKFTAKTEEEVINKWNKRFKGSR